jgi:hypothetical protein
MNCGYVVLVGAVVGITACAEQSAVQADALDGAWRLLSMQLIAADEETVEISVHESLFMFSDGYYSMGYVFGGERPVIYAERWHPSNSEKISRFSSMIVNAGTYEVSGSELVARPLFALAPEFVDGEGHFSYQFTGDTLDLTWERSIAFDGLEYPSGGAVTLLRLVRAD